MAEWSGFFDAHKIGESWDRTYLAEDFAKFFAPLIGNGVFAGRSNELQVFQAVPAGMSVVLSSGQSWIEGYGYINDSDLIIPIDPADGALGRIDRIVNQWSAVDRQIRTVWKKGTPAVNPVTPPLRWDADYKELNLCTLDISAGLAAVTQDKIKDTRADSSVCGWVTGIIDQVDTGTLFAQWEAIYENEFNEQKAAWEKFFGDVQADLGVPIPSPDKAGSVISVSTLGKYILSDKYLKTDDVGDLYMDNHRVANVAEPLESGDAANKRYVESAKEAANAYTDTAKAEAKTYTDTSVRRAAPQNLLDNSDFRNPVNSLGQNAYKFDSGYTIDRWKMHWSGDGNITIQDGYITLYRETHNAYLFQIPANVEKMVGKTYTVAAKVRYNGYIGWIDSTQRTHCDVVHSIDWVVVTHTFTVGSATSGPDALGPAAVEIRTSANLSFELQWIALYEGSYTAETLPEYRPKGYMVEALNCGALHVMTTATLSTSWSGSGPYTQAVTVAGILSTDTPHVMPLYSTTNSTAIAQKEAWACVSKAETSANTITFTCFEEKPTTDIPIQIEVNR